MLQYTKILKNSNSNQLKKRNFPLFHTFYLYEETPYSVNKYFPYCGTVFTAVSSYNTNAYMKDIDNTLDTEHTETNRRARRKFEFLSKNSAVSISLSVLRETERDCS